MIKSVIKSEDDLKAEGAKYLRKMADDFEKGMMTAFAVAFLYKCDKCPEIHGQTKVGINIRKFDGLQGLGLMGLASNLSAEIAEASAVSITFKNVEFAKAQRESSINTKQ